MIDEINDENGLNVVFDKDFSDQNKPTNALYTCNLDRTCTYGRQWGKKLAFGGVRIAYLEYDIHSPKELKWKVDGEVVTMLFNFNGRISTSNPATGTPLEISENRHNIFYSGNKGGMAVVEDMHGHFFMVQLSKDHFLNIARYGSSSIGSFVEKIENNDFAALSGINMDINFSIVNCIDSIVNCRLGDDLKVMFMYSKVIELIALQAESFDNTVNPKPGYINKEYDRERIRFAHDYLLKNLSVPPTLAELSRISGINEYKLKLGFKEMYNMPVFRYLSEVRLQRARNYLLEGSKSITEIAYELGYSSLQHFSLAFKKRFGIPPNRVK